MKLTVGPLPSAVYWRRRAILLGAMLLVLSVLWVSISSVSRSAPPKDGSRVTTTGSSSELLTPTTVEPLDAPGSASGAPGTQSGQVVPAPVAPTVTPCTDAEIAIVPVAEPNPAKRGAKVRLTLKIKNTSARTCSRDLGADAQELYIQLGAGKVWSSDACDALHGTSVQNLPPGTEKPFHVTWGGKASNAGCDEAKRVPPAVGAYQVFGRLGTKISEPVTLSLV